jgi:hypothetical protein
MNLRTAVLLLAGAGATYIAFRHPAVGIAVLVGIAVITVLNVLLSSETEEGNRSRPPGAGQREDPPSGPAGS